MKAIYINLDPYLAAYAAWLKGGKSGPAPTSPSVPLAVTIPTATDVALLIPADETEGDDLVITVDGKTVYLLSAVDSATDTYLGAVDLSAYSGITYWTRPVTGSSVAITLYVASDDSQSDMIAFAFTVLVRRETASGPVDLIDFTPPASAIAAGTDLKGTKFDGNEIVADESTGALSAPAGD